MYGNPMNLSRLGGTHHSQFEYSKQRSSRIVSPVITVLLFNNSLLKNKIKEDCSLTTQPHLNGCKETRRFISAVE
jgi:hypothetical protein